MEKYNGNSNKMKERQKRIEKKVVKGPVKVKKRNEAQKLMDVFISEDISNVKKYIFMDVLVPAIKKALLDIITDGADMMLYGSTGHSRRSNKPAGQIQYSGMYKSQNNNRRPSDQTQTSSYSYDNITLDSRLDAEAVLDRMHECLETYKIVSVGDLLDIVGVTGKYTDYNYGWTNIDSAEIVRVRDGYKIQLPKVMPID